MSSDRTTETDMPERIKQLRQREGLTQQEMGSRVGKSQQAWGRYEKGRSTPSVDVLRKIVNEFEVNTHWLLTGEGQNQLSEDGGEVDVPIYAARLGAGTAGYGEDRIVAYGTFLEGWLRNVAHIDPEQAFICEVRGRSMEDLLEDRDLVLGERKEVVDRQEDIYALELNGHLYVKYVLDLQNRYELRSENPAFDPREVTSEDDFRIIGRVVRRIVR